MILLIDVGNTRMKWMHISGRGRGLAEVADADVLAISLDRYRALALAQGVELFKKNIDELPSHIYISSVLSAEFNQQLSVVLGAAFSGCAIHFAEVASCFDGLQVAYDDISQLGVDRWLGLLASHNVGSKCHTLTVSAGTAITLDYLSSSGEHKGGEIAPGLALLGGALGATARARPLDVQDFSDRYIAMAKSLSMFIGKNTAQCIDSGLLAMVSGILLVSFSQCRKVFGGDLPVKVVVSGGDATLCVALMRSFLSEFELPERFEVVERPRLVFEGLFYAFVR